MLSLVNYGGSDSEDEITDEEQDIGVLVKQNGAAAVLEIDEDLIRKTSTIKLPEPSTNKSVSIIEEEDEFLLKKEVPTVAPPKKGKVKIMIPKLVKDDDEDDKKSKPIQPVNRKTGLLGMLPRPSNCFAPSAAPKPTKHVEYQFKAASTVPQVNEKPAEAVKKVGLIPYSLMAHKPKAPDGEKTTKKKEDSDSDDEEQGGSFFTFASKDEDLPSCEDEVNALVAKETARMEQRKRQNDETEPQDEYENYQSDLQQPQQQNVDEEAMRQLLGGNKAKRSRTDNIQFIDLTAADVLPDRNEWLRKTLAGETSYMPTGNIVDKVRKNVGATVKFAQKLFFIFRVQTHLRRESTRSRISPCERRTTKPSWKRCGRPIGRRSAKEKANTVSKLEQQISLSYKLSNRSLNHK